MKTEVENYCCSLESSSSDQKSSSTRIFNCFAKRKDNAMDGENSPFSINPILYLITPTLLAKSY